MLTPQIHLAAAYMLASIFSCDAQPAPALHFTVREKPPVFVSTRSTRELRALGTTLPNVNLAEFPTTSGITEGKVDLQTSIAFSSQETLTGRYCLWPTEVDVTLSYEAHVYIASEYAPQSCRYAVTKQHELRHVAADEDALREFIPRLKKSAEARAAKGYPDGPFDLAGRDSMKNLVLETFRDGLARDLDKLEADRSRRQLAIDTRAEYTRLSRACPGEPSH